MHRLILGTLVLIGAGACSQQDAAQTPATPAPASVAAPKPLTSGMELTNFDKAVRPQDDLFRHVNGGWLARTEIPADKSNYGSFTMLSDQAEADMREIIEQAAAATNNAPGSEARKIGDLYAAYMDETRAEELALAPIQDELAAIEALADKAALAGKMAELARSGVTGLFGGYIDTDAKKSDQYALYLYQAGIGLPDRDYYFDDKYQDKLAQYLPHVERMLTLAGIADAGKRAADIVKFETRLAKSHWTQVESRDDSKTYNKKTRAELSKLAPGMEFDGYFAALGAATVPELIVRQPSYFTGMAQAVKDTPLPVLKSWLQWSVINQYASLLHKKMVDADFAFFGTALNGTPENRPRWKRAVEAVENSLGEAVGKIYVERHFPPQAKQRMDALVDNLVKAYAQGIEGLEWMGAETKQKALAKLATFDPKIGYPDKWRDYLKLEIKRDDLVGNMQRAAAFELDRNLNKLGKPVDRTEWLMTPQTVNAYYNPGKNEIVFPAAILQPPFFNMQADDAVNYGGIGAVIGHEIGHGFDDQGSKWDGLGNLSEWWTEADRTEFDKRGAALATQYDTYEPLPGLHLNGKFTLGENIGDLAGVTLAYAAYKLALAGSEAPVLDGLTGDQRFVAGWAQVWARKYRDDNLKQRLSTDPHSPSEFRTNGIVRNLPVFYAAFDAKPGDGLYLAPEQRVKIW